MISVAEVLTTYAADAALKDVAQHFKTNAYQRKLKKILNEYLQREQAKIETFSREEEFDFTGLYNYINGEGFSRLTDIQLGDENTRKIAKENLYYKAICEAHASQRLSKQKAEEIIDHLIEITFGYFWNALDPQKKYCTEIILNNQISQTEQLSAKICELKQCVEQFLNDKKDIYTPENLDFELQKETKAPSIGISFFQTDDEEFKICFRSSLNGEQLRVQGSSREETVFTVLNELEQCGEQRQIYILRTEKAWEAASQGNYKGCILISWFYSDKQVPPIPGNLCIFVYSQDDFPPARDTLQLKLRTQRSVYDSLIASGADTDRAEEITRKTQGRYLPIKRMIFSGADYTNPKWLSGLSREIQITALLFNRWTDAEGDRKAIEEMSEIPYDEFMSALRQFMKTEMPFIVEARHFNSTSYRLASPEVIWDFFRSSFSMSNPMWSRYKEILIRAMKTDEEILRVGENNAELTSTLKMGLLETLTLVVFYPTDERMQPKIDILVDQILQPINSHKDWVYISKYLPALAEASPQEFRRKIKSALKEPDELKHFLSIGAETAPLANPSNYVGLLTALEEVLLLENDPAETVKLLLRLDDFSISYRLANSPKDILSRIFCTWSNPFPISPERKIQLLEIGFQLDGNFWNILYSAFAENPSYVEPSFPNLHREPIQFERTVKQFEYRQTVDTYFRECLRHSDTDPSRWIRLIKSLSKFPVEYDDLLFESLRETWSAFSDSGRWKIKNEFRKLIYHTRFFANNRLKDDIGRQNGILNFINELHTDLPEYEDIYLFQPTYDMPILDPVPYNCEDHMEKNRQNVEKLRNRCLQAYERGERSLEILLQCCAEEPNSDDFSEIGSCIGSVLCHECYDKQIFGQILSADLVKTAERYVQSVKFTREELTEAIGVVKEVHLCESLIKALCMKDDASEPKKLLIQGEDLSIKRLFWKEYDSFQFVAEKDFVFALRECLTYGSEKAMLEMLDDRAEAHLLSDEDLFFWLTSADEKNETLDDLAAYYLERILKRLQKSTITADPKKCRVAAKCELQHFESLQWDQMWFTKKILAQSPEEYAFLVAKIFHKDHEFGDSRKNIDANLNEHYYRLWNQAHFCPAEENGRIDAERLNIWIEKLKLCLDSQDQSSLFGFLLGRLFAFSPTGEDGYKPCEAIREWIEFHDDEDLNREFSVAILNERGVYTGSAGKGERELAEKYADLAERMGKYTVMASIYRDVSQYYYHLAAEEREYAVNEL